MRDPRNGPSYDLPPSSGVRQSYVIASLPRSGSTLLARALWDTGLAGAPGEYFNPRHMADFFRRWGRLRPIAASRLALAGPQAWRRIGTLRSLPLPEYVSALKRHRTGANGVFGVKLHYLHLQRSFLEPGHDVDGLLERPRWIWLVRRDHLRQAISYVRALQTDAWRENGGAGEARYDFDRIARRLEDLRAREHAWEAWLAERRIEPLRLAYEGFVASYDRTVRAVLQHIGVAEGAKVRIPAPPLRRQADHLSEDWVGRFRRDAVRRGIPVELETEAEPASSLVKAS